MLKLIILDRDGVINQDSVNYIRSPDDWIPVNGSLEAIAKLTAAGYKIAVITNQSGIARGFYSHQDLQAIHAKMHTLCQAAGGKIDAVYYCPHHPDDHCNCRKPKLGMLEMIANDFACSLVGVPFIGDRDTDIQAARAVNAKPILIKSSMTIIADDMDLSDVAIFSNLAQAVNYLLADDEK